MLLMASCTLPPQTIIPVESFTYVEISMGFGRKARASGVAVSASPHSPDAQIIATAGHVCVDEIAIDLDLPVISDDQPKYQTEITITTPRGKVFPATVLYIDEFYDLCFMRVVGAHLQIAPIAQAMPAKNSIVYNIAAPLGVWQPGTTLMFTGRYSGPWTCEKGETTLTGECPADDTIHASLYALSAYPGSSGSPIFTEDGQVIGIVSAVTPDFPTIVWAVTLDRIQKGLDVTLDLENLENIT